MDLRAQLGGFRARGLEPLALELLGLTTPGVTASRSALCANGAPLQLCLSADRRRERARVIADPGALERTPSARAARAIAALERLLADPVRRELSAPCRALLAAVVPSDPARLPAYRDGVLWLGAAPEGGLALYCEAAPLGVDGGWDVAARAASALVGAPGPVLALIASLRPHAEVASLALEGASAADLRLKIYSRLRRAMPLAELGHGFESPVLLDFAARVVEARRPRLTGLVLSAGFRLADGAALDAKVDLCACPACGARSPEAWSRLLEELGAALGFPTEAARAAVADPLLEVALIGLAQRDGRADRLNTYLAPRLDLWPRRRAQLGLERAVEHLRRQQAADGSYHDFALPVGASDQWVTAFAGLALAEVAARVGLAAAREPAERAAGWLQSHRASADAWGFNERTGPDADSTACAALLLQALGMPVAGSTLDWLEARWRPESGFATYDRADAWGAGHPCVTPVVYAALHGAGRRRLRGPVLGYLRRMERADGSWPSYWWTSPRYAEYAALRLLRALGEEAWARGRGAATRTYPFRTCLELACVVGAEAIRSGDPQVVAPLVLELLRRQEHEGGWPGGADLRVTSPDCLEPWDHPAGEAYVDHRGILTTAMCLRALAEAWEHLPDAG